MGTLVLPTLEHLVLGGQSCQETNFLLIRQIWILHQLSLKPTTFICRKKQVSVSGLYAFCEHVREALVP